VKRKAESMSILIENIERKRGMYTLEVEESYSIKKIKEIITNREGFSIEQRLYYDCKETNKRIELDQDDNTLSMYNIKNKSTLHLRLLMQIFVKNLTGQINITLKVCPSYPIKKVKELGVLLKLRFFSS
jgi:uncharacterized ubiquitin-like protein YukD